jgi:hypothetical protein
MIRVLYQLKLSFSKELVQVIGISGIPFLSSFVKNAEEIY